MKYLLLSVLVVCVIGVMVPSVFAEESFHKKIIFDPSASAQVAELDEINNRLYVLSENTKEKPYTSEIMIIDTSQNSFDVIDAIHFDSLVDFTISKSTNKIYVAPWGSVYISVIDGTTLKEIDRIYPDYATKDCDNSVNWCDPVTKEYGIFSHFNNLIINETTQELFAYSHVFKKILVIDLDTKEYVNYFTAINPDMIGIDEERNLLYYYDKPSTPGKSGLKDSALNGITQNEACLNTTTYFWCTPSNLQKKYSISDKYCTHCFWDFTFDKKNDLIYVRLSDRQNPNEFVVFNLKNDHTGISITNNLLFENPKPIILEDKNLMLFMQLSGGIGHKLHGIIVLDVKNITTGEYEIVKHIDQTDEQLERFLAYDEKNGRLYGKTADAIIAYDIDKLLSSEEVSEEELTQSQRLQNCWSQYTDAQSNLAKQSMQGNLDFLAFNNAKRDLSNHYAELCSQYKPASTGIEPESSGGCGAGTVLVDGVCQLSKVTTQTGPSYDPLFYDVMFYYFGIIAVIAVGGGIIVVIFVVRKRSKTPKPARQELDEYEEQYLAKEKPVKQKPKPVKQKPVEKKETSAFCENCGNTLNPKAKFCGSCGTPVS